MPHCADKPSAAAFNPAHSSSRSEIPTAPGRQPTAAAAAPSPPADGGCAGWNHCRISTRGVPRHASTTTRTAPPSSNSPAAATSSTAAARGL